MQFLTAMFGFVLTMGLGASSAQAANFEAQPAAKAGHEALPPAPKVHPIEEMHLIEQAGVGSEVAYGRSGVLELGGAFNFNGIGSQSSLSLTPSIGWFVVDNVELSALVRVTNSTQASGSRATSVTALFEPSVHLPFTDGAFVFAGLGVGGAYLNGVGGGIAVEPRIGADVMIGRSGVLKPSVGYNLTSTSAQTVKGGTLLAFDGGATANIGYSVMW